jgi:hypothetical protein
VIPGAPADGVALRTLVVGRLPLLVADLGATDQADELHAALVERGLAPLTGFLGVELPKGARVGFVLDAAELRLVDDRDTAMLRAARDGVADDWIDAARRLKGTMTVVVRDLGGPPDEPAPEVVRRLDAAASAGGAIGAVVGMVEERPTLPLLL